ncbi:MAG TPA: hypothetical protein VIK72_03935 [Clostridiaceae bacterium]
MRKQILRLNKNNALLKKNLVENDRLSGNINIIFKEEFNTSLQMAETAELYMSPISNSIKLSKVYKGSTVKLLTTARVSFNNIEEEIWYEVVIPSSYNLNNHGWIKAPFKDIVPTK